MYPVSNAFMEMINSNARKYYWTGSILTKTKKEYAFDYSINKKSWYFLGSIGQGGGSKEIADIGATNFFGDISLSLEDEVVQSLPNGCTWFITEEI